MHAASPGLGFIFHPGELAYCGRQAAPEQHLAARFGAKEAVTKALGIRSFAPLDVEVLDVGAECARRPRLSRPIEHRAAGPWRL